MNTKIYLRIVTSEEERKDYRGMINGKGEKDLIRSMKNNAEFFVYAYTQDGYYHLKGLLREFEGNLSDLKDICDVLFPIAMEEEVERFLEDKRKVKQEERKTFLGSLKRATVKEIDEHYITVVTLEGKEVSLMLEEDWEDYI